MGNTFKTGNYVNGIFQDTSNNIGIGAAPSGTYKFEITGTSKVSGVLTLGATLSNGTYTYTLPAATGTLALTSDIPVVTGFVPYTGATADVNLGIYTLTASGVDSVGYTARGSGTLSGYLIIKQGTTYLGNVVGYNSINANARKYVFISDVDGTNYKSAIFELSSLTNNTDRTYTLPDASGTIALVGGSGVGTVTSVAALTIGTSGTDLSSTVANSTTTPVITLNVPTASAANRGALSSADWTTFNNKYNLPSLTSGSVLFSNGSTIAQDNANFFWDDTNNRLGIGTASPAGKLTILNGTTYTPSAVGGIGGGTAARLQIQGAESGIMLSSDISPTTGSQTGTQAYQLGLQIGFYAVNDIRNQIYFGNAPLTFVYSGDQGTTIAERMRIFSDGNIGIATGASNAGYKLDVNGTGRFSGGDASNPTLKIQAPIYPLIDLIVDNADTNARNWRLAGVYNAYGTFEILSSTTQGGVPTTSRFSINGVTGAATFSSSVTAAGGRFTSPVTINGSSIPSDRLFEVTGSTSTVFGMVLNPTWTYTGANIYGIYAGNNFNTGTITNSYNLYIEATNTGSATVTNKYGIYQSGSGDKNYFAGNVGIGTVSPTGLLEVYKSTSGGLGGHIILNNNGAAVGNETAVIFQDGSSGDVRAAISSTTENSPYFGNIKFKTGGSAYGSLNTRMTITGGGNVLIGTTTDDTVNKLQVNGNIAINKGAANTAIFDTNNTQLSLATGGTANFTNYSGMILVTSFQTGSFQILVCGGGSTASVYLLGAAMGVLTYNSGINGYTYTITAVATATYNFTAFRTRPDA